MINYDARAAGIKSGINPSCHEGTLKNYIMPRRGRRVGLFVTQVHNLGYRSVT